MTSILRTGPTYGGIFDTRLVTDFMPTEEAERLKDEISNGFGLDLNIENP